MGEIIKILTVLALCATKFMTGGFMAIVFKFSVIKFFFSVLAGGVIGILFSVLLSEWIVDFLARIRNKRKKKIVLASKISNKKSNKRVFSKRNRMIIRIKKNYGLIGLSFITPPLLTLPIGSFLAVRFFTDRRMILISMLLSVFLWTVMLTLIRFYAQNFIQDMGVWINDIIFHWGGIIKR